VTSAASPDSTAEPVWALEAERVVADLATDATVGLTDVEAGRRRAVHGPNELPVTLPPPWWRRLAGQLADPVVYLLLVAMAVSIAAWLVEGTDGLPLDAVVIAVIVVANAFFGFLQERRAESALAALRVMTRHEATVVRDGETERLPAADLVPGDLIVLAAGDLVPADARLVEASALRTGEAALTGESGPVERSTPPVPAATDLADRSPMVHRGSIVVAGRGRAVVTTTGTATEVGRIATLLEATESEPTPLQEEIAGVGRMLGAAVVVIAVVVLAMVVAVNGLRSGSDLVEALLIAVSLAVAAVPEGLPAVLTIVLALGVQRMSRRNALVKRLVSVEALGSATIICTDKTGTLTRNEMVVRRMVVPSGRLDLTGTGYGPEGRSIVGRHDRAQGRGAAVVEEARRALTVARLASDATVRPDGERWVAIGDPTEAALVAAGNKLGLDPGGDPGHGLRRSGEIPFTAERRLMSTINLEPEPDPDLDVDPVRDPDSVRGPDLGLGPGRGLLAVKGAPDRVIERCPAERRDGRDVPIAPRRRRWWHDTVDELAADGLRTLAIAYRRLEPGAGPDAPGLETDRARHDDLERDLVLLGVVGIVDPPRAEVGEAVQLAMGAGIRVAMITGDHPVTARRIAAQLGIAPPGAGEMAPPGAGEAAPDLAGAGPRVVTGAELAAADDETLAELVRTCDVYARVAPEHKLRVVRALLAQGEVVAMTGDGVNDAPALKAASIGVAMGVTGSDVSKEAADMILADDNFATIVAAVNEGRAIFHNIRSFLRYLLSSNIGEVLTVLLGVVGAGAIGLTEAAGEGVAVPLLAVQILWINLVTDAAPALALGVDPPDRDLMARPPRAIGSRMIDGRMWLGIGLIGLTMSLAALAMIDLGLPGGLLGGPWWGAGDVETARTGAFTVLVLAQLVNTVNARSEVDSIRGRILLNRWLLGAVGVSLALQVMIVHVPWLNEAMGTTPLGIADWALAAALALSVTVVSELRKAVLRRRDRRGPGGATGPTTLGTGRRLVHT
jgi:magnesium-transporting ATPase (P-type)